MRETVVLGAGPAGMSAAYHLKGKYELFERAEAPGGLMVTHEREGYHFDVTGHWLHLRDRGIQRMVERLLPGGMVRVTRDSRIFSKNVYTLYPFQTNTYGLPLDVVKEIITEYVKAACASKPKTPARTFEEWVLQEMGEGIARHFMIPYNEKLWCTHPREMTPLWCQIYVPKPDLEQILDGALRKPEENIGYNASFIYPKTGGIGTLSKALAAKLPAGRVHYNLHPTSIHVKKRAMTLSDGQEIGYRNLVSSLPLPELVKLAADAPATVRRAASKLVHNQVYYYNIALEKPAGTPAHWVYYPEKPFVFYRAGSYSNAVASMAPKDKSCLYVEISHRGTLPKAAALWKQTLSGLKACGIIERNADVRFHEARNIEYAYVVFDHNYEKSTRAIFAWLEKNGIQSIGRYGRWTYNSMETALIDGREAAKKIRAER